MHEVWDSGLIVIVVLSHSVLCLTLHPHYNEGSIRCLKLVAVENHWFLIRFVDSFDDKFILVCLHVEKALKNSEIGACR